MYSEYLTAKWRQLDDPEVMGWQVAAEAREIADFFESLNYICYDTYATRDFSEHIAGLARGCQSVEHADREIQVHTVNDLHDITMTSYGVTIFEDFLLNRGWDAQMRFYYAETQPPPRPARRRITRRAAR